MSEKKLIINMSFNEMMRLLTLEGYGDKYVKFFEKAASGSPDLIKICERFLYILNFVEQEGNSFDLLKDMVYKNEFFNVTTYLNYHNEYLSQIGLGDIVAYFYMKGFEDFKNKCNQNSEYEFNKQLGTVIEALRTYHFIELNELLRRIKYFDNKSYEKDWAQLDNDDILTRAEIYDVSRIYSKDVTEALILVHSTERYIQDNTEFILVKNYFAREEYERIINLIGRRVNPMIDPYYLIHSHAMLGHVKEVEKLLEDIPAFNEYNITYTLLMLGNHLDLDKVDDYVTGLKDVEKIHHKFEDKIHCYKDQVCPTREKNEFYLLMFEYLTSWLLEFDDISIISNISNSYDEKLYNYLMDKKNVFQFAPLEIKKELDAFFNSHMDNNDRKDLYIKAYEGMEEFFIEDQIKFFKYFCKLNISEVIYEKIYNTVFKNFKSMDPLVQEEMKTLILMAYLDAIGKDKEFEEKFYNLFDFLNIKHEDIEKDKTRKIVRDGLSDNGKKEYDAACILYDMAIESNYKNNDAGMIAMSYYRIIENESNERIVKPLLNSLGKEGLDELLNLSHGTKKCDILTKMFNDIIKNNDSGLMFGNLRYLFRILKYDSKLSKELEKNIKLLLTPYGINEYENKRFDEWYSREKVEMFRNPPAHNKYVHFDMAKEAKQYVETELARMERMFLH